MNDVLTYEALKAERDAALKAIVAMYETVTGERPEWSNWHAYLDDIVEEVCTALAAIEARGVEGFIGFLQQRAKEFPTAMVAKSLEITELNAEQFCGLLREAK